MRILGVDWGDRKMGISITDPLGIIARGVGVFYGDEEEKIEKLKKIVKDYGVELIILGLPLTLSGEKGKEAKKIIRLKEKLEKILKIKVKLVDERFTTKIANLPLSKNKKDRKKQKKRILDDVSSAIIILNTYLEREK